MGKLAGVARSVLGVGACLVVAITGCAAEDDGAGLEPDPAGEEGIAAEHIGEATEAFI